MTGAQKKLREIGHNIRVHGNGFLQLDLNENGTKRLHIFSEELPRQKVATPIHDHVFDMRSHVVYGTLIHMELTPVEDPKGGYRVFRAEQQPGTQNTILVPDEGTVRLEAEQYLRLGEGSMYTFPHGRLHLSDHVPAYGDAVTVMFKENPPEAYGRPRVLVPVGQEPDNEFHRDGFDEDALWKHALRYAGNVEQAGLI